MVMKLRFYDIKNMVIRPGLYGGMYQLVLDFISLPSKQSLGTKVIEKSW